MSKVEVIICRNENMIFRKQKSRQLQAKSTLQARTQLMSAANKCSELHLCAQAHNVERDTLPQGSRKKLRSKILWEKELLWSDLQVAERRLALSEMNSDAVSYTYAAKGDIMWKR